jgi:5-methylcytosine-specific restriction protein A
MPKLQTLKPRLQAAGGRLTVLAPARPGVVERKRGYAGVKDRQRIRERDCGLCQECKRQGRTTVGHPVDHIIPLWAGGSDADINKETLCIDCHDAKSAREAGQRAAGWR